jgi:PiT family inorganic phosphate transporter
LASGTDNRHRGRISFTGWWVEYREGWDREDENRKIRTGKLKVKTGKIGNRRGTMPGVLLLLPGLLMAWVIGANDAANSLGTAVGSGVRTPREGAILAALFGLAGTVVMGGRVVKTLGEGILPLPHLPGTFANVVAFSSLTAAGLTVLICTALHLPVSTSHAVTGGLVGGGIAAGLRSFINWGETTRIFLAWVFTPVATFLLAMVLYRLARFFRVGETLNRTLLRASKPYLTGKMVKLLVTITGCYMAFSWGANDVANATGILSGVLRFSPLLLAFAGGLVMGCGVLVWGKKVMMTIGKRITRLSPVTALTAEFVAAVVVHFFTIAGLPVSTTHAIVGAVGGIGFSRGKKEVDSLLLWEIVLTWVLTPFFSGSLAFFLYRLLQLLLVVIG